MTLLPRTLAGRLFLILVSGMLLAVGLTYALVRIERGRELGQFRLRVEAERIASPIRLLDALPAGARPAAQKAMEQQRIRVWPDEPAPPAGAQPVPPLADALASLLGGQRDLQLLRLREEPCRFVQTSRQPEAIVAAAAVDCSVVVYNARLTLADGGHLSIDVPLRSLRPEPPFILRPYAFLVFILLIAASSLVAVRVAMRPLRNLVRAAEVLGRDIECAPLAEAGPRELQVAARAFNAMQGRIRSHLDERTHMLAAITHDLKTPLTRMRLRCEQVDKPELKARLAQDISAMQSLIDEGLNVARSLDDKAPFVELDLRSLVDSVCADAVEAGMSVAWDGGALATPAIRVKGRADALRRALFNLIDNAVKYGRRAHVSLSQDEPGRGAAARVIIRDEGPGIPEAQLEHVLEPFVRVEGSRSRDTGGTGLGLTIASNIIRAHKGNLILRNLSAGGLEARAELPAIA